MTKTWEACHANILFMRNWYCDNAFVNATSNDMDVNANVFNNDDKRCDYGTAAYTCDIYDDIEWKG